MIPLDSHAAVPLKGKQRIPGKERTGKPAKPYASPRLCSILQLRLFPEVNAAFQSLIGRHLFCLSSPQGIERIHQAP
jgi:hypothetical protein